MYRWNDEKIRKQFIDEMKKATQIFTDEELERLDLSRLSHKTKSKRIYHMISLAYTLGKLKGIHFVDGGEEGETIDKCVWNNVSIEKYFYREISYIEDKFTPNEYNSLEISNLLSQTKSQRITHMVSLSYTLGRLKGIQSVDEGKTPIVLRGFLHKT